MTREREGQKEKKNVCECKIEIWMKTQRESVCMWCVFQSPLQIGRKCDREIDRERQIDRYREREREPESQRAREPESQRERERERERG